MSDPESGRGIIIHHLLTKAQNMSIKDLTFSRVTKKVKHDVLKGSFTTVTFAGYCYAICACL